jgi:hypothetical protein
VFYALRAARRAGADAEAARLDAELRRLTAAAGALEEANAFGALLQRAGAVGLNATTSHDATKCAPARRARAAPRARACFALRAQALEQRGCCHAASSTASRHNRLPFCMHARVRDSCVACSCQGAVTVLQPPVQNMGMMDFPMLGEWAGAAEDHACSAVWMARDVRSTLLRVRAGQAGRAGAGGGRYFASLPANKLELWFALEAERFQARAPAAHPGARRTAGGDAAPCTVQF